MRYYGDIVWLLVGAERLTSADEFRYMMIRLADHRLVATFEVDQRKATMAESNAVCKIRSFAVRSAVRHDVAHVLQDLSVLGLSMGEAANSAHGRDTFSSVGWVDHGGFDLALSYDPRRVSVP